MQVSQITISRPNGAENAEGLMSLAALQPNWVVVFGAVDFFTDESFVGALREAFPAALVTGCSTAGEIAGTGVLEDLCVVTAVRFEHCRLRQASTVLTGMADSLAAGERIGAALAAPDLKAIMVFGPGLEINGSALVEGVARHVGAQLPITGGLAGDGGRFVRTLTLGPEGVSDRAIVAVGFVGDELQFAHGSFGGWESFGPARRVTRSAGNILYELDGEPALDVYKRYLGDHAADLPASGLLFPFAMHGEDHDALGLIRTILGVDEATGSLTLAGAIDPNGYLKLMHASTDQLVNGAESAAAAASAMARISGPSLAILVSCVGRKLVMGDRVEEEVDVVSSILGPQATLAGFYSYGEICPLQPGSTCHLHNQTMTITWLGEH